MRGQGGIGNDPQVESGSGVLNVSNENGMKKRRGLKRYYRKLRRQDVSEDWIEALSDEEAWFNLEHFDWSEYGNISWREHKEHLDVLFRNFSIMENRLKEVGRPVQMFAVVHTDNSEEDALYFHTPNPHRDYPIDCIKYGCAIGIDCNNEPMAGYLRCLESQGYTVLTSPKASNDYWLGSYIVFKSGVGESLIPRNEIKPAE